MPQIFDRSSNALARMSLVLTGLIVIALGVTLDQLQRSPWVTRQGRAPDQPVPFSQQVMSTSTDGTTWSAVQRIPTDAVGSGADHFIPGLAVDSSTSGSSAHLALAYYFYPNASCTTATCQLEVGFVSSVDGGNSWSASTTLTFFGHESDMVSKHN